MLKYKPLFLWKRYIHTQQVPSIINIINIIIKLRHFLTGKHFLPSIKELSLEKENNYKIAKCKKV